MFLTTKWVWFNSMKTHYLFSCAVCLEVMDNSSYSVLVLGIFEVQRLPYIGNLQATKIVDINLGTWKVSCMHLFAFMLSVTKRTIVQLKTQLLNFLIVYDGTNILGHFVPTIFFVNIGCIPLICVVIVVSSVFCQTSIINKSHD